jgi:hypothetical protein
MGISTVSRRGEFSYCNLNIGNFVTSKDEVLLGIKTTEKGNEFLNSVKFREFLGQRSDYSLLK